MHLLHITKTPTARYFNVHGGTIRRRHHHTTAGTGAALLLSPHLGTTETPAQFSASMKNLQGGLSRLRIPSHQVQKKKFINL